MKVGFTIIIKVLLQIIQMTIHKVNRRKSKYKTPQAFVVEVQPWELIASTTADVDVSPMPGGSNDDPFGPHSKSNSFFTPFSDDEEYTEE